MAPVLAAVRGIEQAVATALDALAAVDPAQVAREEGLDLQTVLRAYAWLGAHADALRRSDVDTLTEVLDDALRERARVATLERAEERDATDGDRFVLQLRVDGTSASFGTWSAESTAVLADALHAEADAPQAAPCPGEATGSPSDVAGADPEAAPSRPRQLAAALLRLVTRGRTGASQPTPPARFTVLVDVDRATDATAGTLQLALRGRPSRLTRRTLDRLTCDAAIDAVVRDGADLLAAQRYAPEVPAATRRAVVARDGGCRWPGCRAPVGWCDVHHVAPRASGDDHHPANLVLLCRRHHTTVHRRGWSQHVEADGTWRLTRRGRRLVSRPRQQRPPPGRGGDDPPDDDPF